jgi:flagellar hook-basal body complex protein FliE
MAMTFDINGAGAGSSTSALTRATKTAVVGAPGAADFAEKLGSLITNVEETAADANTAITNMVDKSGDVHEAMIALQRAEMTLQLTVQVRNKLVQAYQDIMRMPI